MARNGNIALCIRRLMRKRGWKQRDLANRTGLTEVTISSIMNGKNEPRISTLREIRNAFGCSWSELLDGEGGK